MRDQEVQVRPLLRFIHTTESRDYNTIFPNLARGFSPAAGDQL
jgi:hypothetical protein